MKKIEIVHALREQENLEMGQAHCIVDLFFDSITQVLVEGDRAEIRDFCTFAIKSYPAYTGRNPRSEEKVHVKEKKLPVFRAGQELKKRVDCSKDLHAESEISTERASLSHHIQSL